MFDAHKNFAASLVATAPSPASSGTSLVVTAADGAKFPAVPFNATVWPTNVQPTTTNAEIVRVTNRSTDTLTITRAQEGTSARTIVVGDNFSANITVKTLTDVELGLIIPHEFGGLAGWIPVPVTSYPSGATLDLLAPNTDIVDFDSVNIPSGTYILEAILAAEGGATVSLALVNLTDGAPDTGIVTITSTSATGAQVQSGAITFAGAGASKKYAVKLKGSSATLRYAAWGIRIRRTA